MKNRPTKNHVNAALALVDGGFVKRSDQFLILLDYAFDDNEGMHEAAARILAAEVRWLRDGRDKTRESMK